MHQPTLRVLQILEAVTADGKEKRLSEFSRDLNIPKSTLLPILQTLCRQRYLVQDDVGRYQPGTALFSLGAGFSDCFPVLKYVHQQLELLVNALGETCYFGILDGSDVLYLDKVDSSQPLRMLTNIGKKLPAYATGIGKALLIGKSAEELKALYPDGFTPLTDKTITDPEILHAQLIRGEFDGYTWEIEESTPHVRCFAVPIRKFGKIVAAISVSIPLFRFQHEQKDTIIHTLLDTASAMSKTIENTNAHFGETF